MPTPGLTTVKMFRPHLRDIPPAAFPAGYSIRNMLASEGNLWEDVQRDAEPFFPIEAGLFHKEFGSDTAAIPQRCYLIIDAKENPVGTISGWYNATYRGGLWGQVHWVAVHRAHQGRGLAKAGLTYTLHRLAQHHDRAFLGTHTERVGAIKIYLDYGFVPDLEPEGAVAAWRSFREKVDHPGLDGLPGNPKNT